MNHTNMSRLSIGVSLGHCRPMCPERSYWMGILRARSIFVNSLSITSAKNLGRNTVTQYWEPRKMVLCHKRFSWLYSLVRLPLAHTYCLFTQKTIFRIRLNQDQGSSSQNLYVGSPKRS